MHILEQEGGFYVIDEDTDLKKGPFNTTTDALQFWNDHKKIEAGD